MQILLKSGFLPPGWVPCSRTYIVHLLLLELLIGNKFIDQDQDGILSSLFSLFFLSLHPPLQISFIAKRRGKKQHQQFLCAVKYKLFFPSFLVKQTLANWLLSLLLMSDEHLPEQCIRQRYEPFAAVGELGIILVLPERHGLWLWQTLTGLQWGLWRESRFIFVLEHFSASR